MKIKVTQEHIDAGKQCCAMFCPIALAIKEATDCKFVGVFSYISIDKVYEELTPPEVFSKLQYFDRTGAMEPFDFEIEDLP